jgi:hypothetical protein
MQVSEVLERTLQTLEDEGWCKGAYSNEDGRCVVSGLWAVIGEEHEWQHGGQSLMMACLKALRETTGIPNIALWNDAKGRTFSDVQITFRRAIAATSAREQVAA